MYIPPAFRQTDAEAQRALIAAHPLAQLISLGEQGLQADPLLLLLLDRYPDGAWRRRGHLARPILTVNSRRAMAPVWRFFKGRQVIFPLAGMRPRRSTAKSCRPGITRRCIAHGQAQVINDPAWLMALLQALTDNQKARRQVPWRIEDAPPDFIDTLIGAIVGDRNSRDAHRGKMEIEPKPQPGGPRRRDSWAYGRR